MQGFLNFVLEVFSCFSRLLNVFMGGSADMTFSARSHRDGLKCEATIDWFARMIFRERDHCRKWWFSEVSRAAKTVELHKEKMQAAALD